MEYLCGFDRVLNKLIRIRGLTKICEPRHAHEVNWWELSVNARCERKDKMRITDLSYSVFQSSGFQKYDVTNKDPYDPFLISKRII